MLNAVLRRLVMTSAGPTARANDKKKGSRLVFGSDGTRVLDRGENFSVALNNFADSDRLFFFHHLSFSPAGVWKKFKYCSQCNLIMVERAKWAKNFDEVKYCSDKCRNTAKRGSGKTESQPLPESE